jgi:predicted nucleic acid-binding protein
VIVLDTNVVSELLRTQADPAVSAWAGQRPSSEYFLTSMVVAELLSGVRRLAPGRRRTSLTALIDDVVLTAFESRVLAFDASAAPHFADVLATRTRSGRPITTADAVIAATCLGHGARLATRNTKDFEGIGLDLVDPWGTE